MKNAGKACNNRLYRHIRTFEKIIKNYFVILNKIETTGPKSLSFKAFRPAVFHFHSQVDKIIRFAMQLYTE